MSEEDQLYIKQMNSWIKEQEALAKQIRTTIETSSEIVEQNKLQLGWLLERVAKGVKEYEGWKAEKGVS